MSTSLDASDLFDGLDSFEERSMQAVRMFAESGAQKLESEAKQNARWTDRSGAARQRLNGSVSDIPKGYRLSLAHGVDYGIWLELAHEKRFSIIPETIRYVGTFDIMPAFANLMQRLKK